MTVSLPAGIHFSLPVLIVGILFIIEMLTVSQLGLCVFNRVKGCRKLEQGNEVAGILFGAIALIYSLILAFVIMAEWDDYNDLDKVIQAESDKLNAIIAHSSTLPENLKQKFGNSIYQYCDQVVNQEWQMRESKEQQPSAIPELRHIILNTAPADKIQERVFNEVDKNLSDISDLRRERLSHTHSQMPQLVWNILKAGTLIIIFFAYFFHVPSLTLKRIYLALMVTCISMCMFLVYTLDHPFDGDSGVSSQPYQEIKQELKEFYQ